MSDSASSEEYLCTLDTLQPGETFTMTKAIENLWRVVGELAKDADVISWAHKLPRYTMVSLLHESIEDTERHLIIPDWEADLAAVIEVDYILNHRRLCIVKRGEKFYLIERSLLKVGDTPVQLNDKPGWIRAARLTHAEAWAEAILLTPDVEVRVVQGWTAASTPAERHIYGWDNNLAVITTREADGSSLSAVLFENGTFYRMVWSTYSSG